MPDDPPYILDIHGMGDAETPPTEAGAKDARAWIGIHFECCGVYTRVYRNRDGTAYEGHCPRCTRPIRVRVGPGGTSNRMFRAT